MISIENLSFSYDNGKNRPFVVLNDMSIKIPESSFISILGPSGSGKTTLLNCLGGLLAGYDGKISFDNKTPSQVRDERRISMIFQKPVFFEWLNIYQNISLPLRIAKKENFQETDFYLEKFELENYKVAYPKQMSGGMLARVALARALVNDPEYILMDEAFNFLDEILREKINLYIQDYWHDKKPTIVVVTHNINEAVFLSDRIIVLSNKPATIFEIIEIPLPRPRDPSILFSKEFVDIARHARTTLDKINLIRK